MRLFPAFLGVVLVLFSCGDGDLTDLTLLDGGEGPGWLDDLDQAFQMAAETDRPLLIVFR